MVNNFPVKTVDLFQHFAFSLLNQYSFRSLQLHSFISFGDISHQNLSENQAYHINTVT